MIIQCQEKARANFPVGPVGTLHEVRARTLQAKPILTHPMGISSGIPFQTWGGHASSERLCPTLEFASWDLALQCHRLGACWQPTEEPGGQYYPQVIHIHVLAWEGVLVYPAHPILKFQLSDLKCRCNAFNIYPMLQTKDASGSDHQIYEVEYLYWMEEYMCESVFKYISNLMFG